MLVSAGLLSDLWKQIFLGVLGISAGLSVAGGVFTVFTAVGLVPRFAEHTGSGDRILKYENSIILGCFFGCLFSLFVEKVGGLQLSGSMAGDLSARILLGIFGLFTGLYVGTLAISIAELLDAIPIMTHRMKVKRGVSFVIAGLAIGKLVGSLFYYINGVYGW